MVDKTTIAIVATGSFVAGYALMIEDGPNLTNFWYTAFGLFGIFAVYQMLRIHPRGLSKDVRFYQAPAIYILALVTTLNLEHKLILGHGLSLVIQIVSALALIIWVLFLEMTGYFKNNL